MNLSPFCTCNNTDCPLHPTRHNKGCAPCIAKNLKLQEIPNCFFQKVEGNETRIYEKIWGIDCYYILTLRCNKEKENTSEDNPINYDFSR